MTDLVTPSERLSLFLSDGRNIAIFFLSPAVLILSILLALDYYVRIHTPPLYELQADATRYREAERMDTDQAIQEIRNRLNAMEVGQAATDRAINNQMDTLRGQIDLLSGATTRHSVQHGR